MDPRWLPADFPRLFHVAEAGAWPSIKRHGLLSTSALLDLFGLEGPDRVRLEAAHRPEPVTLSHQEHGHVVLRDQKPLDLRHLAECLDDETTVEEWLRLLNSKVFLWASEDRLNRLLGASAYRHRAHDVLIVETRLLVARYAGRIALTQMNTGATRPARARRGRSTFRSITIYPEEPRERRRIAEVAVDYAVPDIANYVLHVERRQGAELVETVWAR